MACYIIAQETQPTDAPAPTAAQERIAVIDVLRGFTWLIAVGFQMKFIGPGHVRDLPHRDRLLVSQVVLGIASCAPDLRLP